MAHKSLAAEYREMLGIPGLDSLVDRLKPGMSIDARIVDVMDHGIIILRIWGYNILTESKIPFEKFEEVVLNVKSVKPRLIFSIHPTTLDRGGAIYA